MNEFDPASLLLEKKILPGGRIAEIIMQIFSWRIIVSEPENDGIYWTDAWCYDNLRVCIDAFLRWDGEGEPHGWIKNPPSGRRQPAPPSPVGLKSPTEIKMLVKAALMRGFEVKTEQADGAWPNGSRVVKTEIAEGDAHGVGEFATVVGSAGPVAFGGRERCYGYFLFWDRPPGNDLPVFCNDGRLGLVPRSSKEGDACLANETHLVQSVRQCPDCGTLLREGPHGGLSVNWYCNGASCGSRFNDMGPFGVQRISEAMPCRSS
jgi:hypothetical protein